ncbi:MAG: hydrogenase [Candidatus Brocadiia bacterium]
MWDILIARLKQKYRTIPYPKGLPVLPERFIGRPAPVSNSAGHIADAVKACPTAALKISAGNNLSLDMGRCVFCGQCARIAPDAVTFGRNHSLAGRTRAELILKGKDHKAPEPLDTKLLKLFGKSLKLRQVSAGGCGACEADTNVLNTVVFDLGRFGIQFVASPRHADGLLITGPVTKNMRLALGKTYAALPKPKIVIATGACAISGGLFSGHPESCDGADTIVPVDLYIPGCPPHPLTILDGMLRLLGKA